MSLASNTLVGFISLGAASVTSFLLANSRGEVKKLLPPPAIVVQAQAGEVKEKIEPTPTITEILKLKGYEGCDYLNGQRGRKILFVCWQKLRADEIKPSLFRYDRVKARSNGEVKTDHILGITYHNSNSATLRFKETGTDSLSLPPAWMGKWKDKGEFDPESICSFQKSSGSAYDLKCGDKVVQNGIHI